MSDTLTLLYILLCIYYAYVTCFIYFFFFFAYHFFGKKNVLPSFHGCADITSLNEMLTYSWGKHTHVFSSQLSPSIRFYIS